MEVELRKYQWFRDFVRRALLLSGFWPYLGEISGIYKAISFLSLGLFAAMAAKGLTFCVDNITSLSNFVNAIPIILSMCVLTTKVVCYSYYHEDLVLVDSILREKFEEDLNVKEYQPVLLVHISQYHRLTYTTTGVYAFAVMANSIGPIIIALKFQKYIYIFLGKFPFAVVGGSSLYWILLSIEVITGYFMFMVTIAIDNGFGLYSFRMCSILRLLGYKFSQLRTVAELVECVHIHHMILRCCNVLQRVYGPIVFATYFTNSIALCILMYQVDQINRHTSLIKVFFITFYIMTKLVQAFIYAYYGALVSTESEKLFDAVYTSDWATSGNLELMKDILMIRTQRTIILNIKNYFHITMDVFAKIVNTSISYFFLLKTVTKEDEKI